MFLRRDNLSASSADRVEYYEKVHNNLVERTKQLKRANHELAHQIAERQRVEEALRQAEQKYRSIFENAVEGIFQTTPNGSYLDCNPALARIYGYESAEELLKNLTDIGRQLYVDPSRRQEFIERLHACDAVSDFESQVYRQDGSIIWISENARAVRDADSTLLYYEGFVTDITQRKLAEAIDLEFLIEDFPKTLSSMQLGADRIRQIVQSLRSFSRIDEAEMTRVDIHQGIDSTLLIINNRLKPKGDHSGITLIKEYGELPLVKGYAGLLNQVFMNLLCNAIDALEDCPPGLCGEKGFEEQYRALNVNAFSNSQAYSARNRSGTQARQTECVSVSEHSGDSAFRDQETLASPPSTTLTSVFPQQADPASAYSPTESPKIIRICTEIIEGDSSAQENCVPRAVIRIIDNGPGMPEDIRSQIFHPFFTTKPVGKGTGLGLSISYQIVVEKHGGQLQCISAPNQGTEFRIEIPIQP